MFKGKNKDDQGSSELNFFLLDQESDTEKLKVIGEKSEKIFKDSLNTLQNIITQFDPLQIPSVLAYYTSIFHQTKERPQDFLLPAYVEFVQALTLKLPIEKFEEHPMLGKHIEQFQKSLSDLFHADLTKAYKELSDQEQNTENYKKYIQSHVQGKTKIERDWAFSFQVVEFAKELFKPLNQKFHEIYNVSIQDLLEEFDNINRMISDRIIKHSELINPAYNAKTWQEALHVYWTRLGVTPDPKQMESEFLKIGLKSDEEKLATTIGFISSHHDLKLSEVFTIHPTDLKNPDTWNVIEAVSISFGDLNDKETAHFFMDNPVLKKPFISLKKDELQIPCYWSLSHYRIEIIEKLIRSSPPLNKYYLDKQIKGKFLEEATLNLLKDNFSQASIFTSSELRNEKNTDTENDILLILDHTAILVECKSADLSDSSKRGSLRRLKEDFKQNIIKAYTQLESFTTYLKANQGPIRLPKKGGGFNEFDTSAIKQWIKLIVTLKPMGFLSAHTPTLQKAELLDISDRDLISTISLPDLQIIMNLLPNQAHKIHYLQKRKVVEESFNYFGDELDLLGLYLKTSFNLPENSETNWIISDLASSIYKIYSTGRFLNDRDEKPSINTTQYFMDIINSLQDRSTPGWSVLTSFLLNIPHGDQKEIEKGILSLREENLKNHQFIYANYRYRLLGIDYILMIYFHDLSDKDERDELMYQVMNQLKEEKGILEFAAIGFNKSNERYPYNLVGYFSYNS